ncbi:uncharacterized protein K489DRAFT_416902 [Dissoconium aciculare CBS 342.82]|jgi:hypothetical protein|uniref:Uncharacterized protein n=1 Tax=Dissoconium aciculare CBS 342.82 TaxID=1314786 RepID=A0A6J3LVQ5_9PEZI|nr:uncharacterized protein K489DRAFT_416902 [Dissoconium aciculare CBS 342.82]KAF1819763.1 hypothetical protein K489DRAFT_416902 [Dissoconium aciculare CBS 342.82]
MMGDWLGGNVVAQHSAFTCAVPLTWASRTVRGKPAKDGIWAIPPNRVRLTGSRGGCLGAGLEPRNRLPRDATLFSGWGRTPELSFPVCPILPIFSDGGLALSRARVLDLSSAQPRDDEIQGRDLRHPDGLVL